MAEKRKSNTHNTLLDGSSKKMLSTRTDLSLATYLLNKPLGTTGTTSTKLNLTAFGSSSLLSSPLSLTSRNLSLTSKLMLEAQKPQIESGLLKLSLHGSGISKVEEPKLTEKKKTSFRDHSGKTRHEPVKKSFPQKRSIVKTVKSEKKKKIENPSGKISTQNVREYNIGPPSYEIKCDNKEEYTSVDIPDFVPPIRDLSLVKLSKRSQIDVTSLKRGLINTVSGSLISQPKFTDIKDETRQVIMENVATMAVYDPEFVLKVALYSRKELNIRTTSNFLLALASSIGDCRQYLKKYYNASIALPSDWMEVAEIFQTLEGNNLKLGSLPSALRKVMTSRFVDFDKYQLAKYNKESSGKKKKAKEKKAKLMNEKKKKKNLFDSDSSDSEGEGDHHAKANRQLSGVSYDDKVTEAELRQQRFTIKQLIRKLHITNPVEHVMCIIGKKYPDSLDKFYQARLPGTFEEDRAGKRMKLPIPETWETQVSLKGNKAKTWEDLIDHKKLPFMAMLRNLRNLIKAGISTKHHNMILQRLQDKRQVVNSKQFPFRFFSAYVVLSELEEAYEKNQKDIIAGAVAATSQAESELKQGFGRGRGRGRGRPGSRRGRDGLRAKVGAKETCEWWKVKKMNKQQKCGLEEVPYDKDLLQRYRNALDTAVKIATTYNVQPIKGRTIILCDYSEYMDKPCTSAKGIGPPRTIMEISALMGLMCQHACESCQFIIFNEDGHRPIYQDTDMILTQLSTILHYEILDQHGMKSGLPCDILYEALTDRIQIDNLLVFSQDLHPQSDKGKVLNDFLSSYRHSVNPNLLYVGMTFSSPRPGFDSSIEPQHENDIYLSGYSDSILRFIAERGDSGLLQHVDKIDEAFQLRQMPKATASVPEKAMELSPGPENGLHLTVPKPSWRTIRVFISSTFRDMHGERDLLTRFIFPELRSIARKHFINVYEVDLRWGITEDEVKSHQALTLCLEEVNRCQLFVGLLGERYGWVPDSYEVPDTAEFDWVREYSPGASVTELEMYAGALAKVKDVQETAFFFLRNSSFEKDVPPQFVNDFSVENNHNKTRMQILKKRIKNSGLQVFESYPCRWGGCMDSKPIVSGLEDFGANMLNTLINAVKKLCPQENEILTEEIHINNQHWAAVEKHSGDFVGRSALIKQIIGRISSTSYGVIGLVGKVGCGKTALMAATIKEYMKATHLDDGYNILINVSGAAPGSNNLAATLRRLAQLLNTRFALGHTMPEDFKNLIVKFEDLLVEASNVCASKLVIFLDGVDAMENNNNPCSLEWLPSRVPDNVVFVLTAVDGDITAKSLKRIGAFEINIGALDMWDKAEIVRQTLARHRKSLKESGFGNEMKLLMLKKDAHNPLYLKLACEELRVFGVFDKIGDKLKSLPHTMPQMLQEILIRLENDHGKDIISICLSFLACARDGLLIEELQELLTRYQTIQNYHCFDVSAFFMEDLLGEFELPPVTFTYLVRSIMSFVNPSSAWSPVLSLPNAEIKTAVRLRYLKGEKQKEDNIHRVIAGFFWLQSDPSGDKSWKGQNARAFAQLPYHLACGRLFPELASLLCGHKFIQAKCAVGQATGLLDDYELKESLVKDKEATKVYASPAIQQYKTFVSRNIEILVSYPSLEFQQALNEPNSSMPYIDALNEKETCHSLSPHMIWLDKPDEENQCYRTLSNLKMVATCIKVSPTGSVFATGSQDAIVRLYDKATGKELNSFMGHSDTITDVCFVNNRVLCSASADTTLCVWDTEFGHRIHVLKGHNRRVNACSRDLSGQTIASGSWDGSVILWNATNGNKIYTFDIGSPVNSIHFHPEFELLAVASWDKKIRIFNTLHQKRVAVLHGHQESVRDVVFSNDGRHLASADMDGDVQIRDSKKGVVVGSVKGHSEPITKILFSPSGKELITAGNDHLVKVWSSDLGIPMRCLASEKLGAATSVVLSHDGTKVAIGYHAGLVRVHSVHTGVMICEVKVCASPVRALHFHEAERFNSRFLLAGCDEAFIQVVDVTKGSSLCKLSGHSKPVLCVTSHKNTVISGEEGCSVVLHRFSPDLPFNKIEPPTQSLMSHTAPVTALCSHISHKSIDLISGSRDSSVCFYSFSSDGAKVVKNFPACHADWINAVGYDLSTQCVVTGSNDFNIKVWDEVDLKEKCTLTGHEGSVNSVDSKYGFIVSGSSDNNVKLWSHKGISITTLKAHTLRVNACAMYTGPSRNKGKEIDVNNVIVASAGDDGDVWLWKPFLANQLSSLSGHSNRVLSVSADKEGRVTSCSLDGSVRMWTPRLKEKIGEAVHDAPVTFMELSKNGTLAISGSRDGVVKVWKFDPYTNLLVAKCSYQAHSKSVNCGCFIWESNNQFVTGGNDSCLTQWEIVDQKNGFFVREKTCIKADGPIVSVEYWNEGNGMILYSIIYGSLHMVKASGESHIIHEVHTDAKLQILRHWVTCILIDPCSPELIKCGTSFNTWEIVYMNAEHKTSAGVKKETIDTTIDDPHKFPPNWVCCMTQAWDRTLMGDSKGQIFLSDSDGGSIIKIHKSDITSIQVIGQTVFTASTDATIKVWTLQNEGKANELQQVGQFFCVAPVTSMRVVTTSHRNASMSVYLAVGDQLGNIHQLKWQSNCI